MELEIVIAGGIFITFLSLIGYKSFKNYLTIENQKSTSSEKANFENEIRDLKNNLLSITNSRNGLRTRMNILKNEYDLDYSDLELEEGETTKLIPEIAEALFPKLPPSVKQLLGKDGIEEAIFKYIGDNPDKLGTWINKFIPKKEVQDQRQIVLKETYI